MSFEIRDIWDLPHRRIGRRVFHFDRIDSTNTYALELADCADNDGLAVLAGEQLAGRGQHGRTWQAPPRSSVLLSVLLFAPEPLSRPALLTAWAAVGVCEVVRECTGLAPRIKWPNDVLLDGRKVCGILIEQRRQGGRTATVVGIGLNVSQSEADFAMAGLPLATSLAARGGTCETHAVARRLLEVLDATFDRLFHGDRERLQTEWQDRLGLLGCDVVVECGDGDREGRLVECALDGVVIQLRDDTFDHFLPEMILHIRSR